MDDGAARVSVVVARPHVRLARRLRAHRLRAALRRERRRPRARRAARPAHAAARRRDARVHGLRAHERDGVQPLGRPRRRREEPAHQGAARPVRRGAARRGARARDRHRARSSSPSPRRSASGRRSSRRSCSRCSSGTRYAKRFTWGAHAWLGVALALAPGGAWIAMGARAERGDRARSWSAVVTWLLGFDVLYSLQDERFDRENGLHSIPARFGTHGRARAQRGGARRSPSSAFVAAGSSSTAGPSTSSAVALVDRAPRVRARARGEGEPREDRQGVLRRQRVGQRGVLRVRGGRWGRAGALSTPGQGPRPIPIPSPIPTPTPIPIPSPSPSPTPTPSPSPSPIPSPTPTPTSFTRRLRASSGLGGAHARGVGFSCMPDAEEARRRQRGQVRAGRRHASSAWGGMQENPTPRTFEALEVILLAIGRLRNVVGKIPPERPRPRRSNPRCPLLRRAQPRRGESLRWWEPHRAVLDGSRIEPRSARGTPRGRRVGVRRRHRDCRRRGAPRSGGGNAPPIGSPTLRRTTREARRPGPRVLVTDARRGRGAFPRCD